MTKMKSQIAAALIGNTLEWYDFGLFGLFALAIAHHFFPASDHRAALLGSFSIFAVGYLLRPLGGMIFGHIGDRASLRRALIITILLMGIATSLMGLLPSYESIGLSATILLVLLRVIQGIAVGGEFPGSFVLLTSTSPEGKKAFYSSLALIGAILGMLLAATVARFLTAYLGKSQMQSFGWRIPFVVGIVLAGIGLYLRLYLFDQNHHVTANTQQDKIPLITLLKTQKRALIKAFLLLSYGATITGLLSIFLNTFLQHYLKYSSAASLSMVMTSTVVMLIVFPLAALLSDQLHCHLTWLRTGLLLMALTSYPLFALFTQGSSTGVIGLYLLVAISYGAVGPFIPIVIDCFPTSVRYSGVAITHGLAFSLIAGLSPLLFTHLVNRHGVMAPAFIVALVSILGFLATYL